MSLFLESFWRALAYCLLPRVMLLSFLPLLLVVGLTVAAVYFFWDSAVLAMQSWLGEMALLDGLIRWLEEAGAGALSGAVAPLMVMVLTLPVIIVLSLLVVSWFMTPAIVSLVAERRFSDLERREGGSLWRSALLSIGASVLALVALLISMPLWLIPPLVVILPPLIWGWLTYRVMHYDVLAAHASREERVELVLRHRPWLLVMGVFAGYLGAAPAVIWAIGAMAFVLAPLLIPLTVWIYTFVFAFTALWFAHYCLAALAALRAEPVTVSAESVPSQTDLADQARNLESLPRD